MYDVFFFSSRRRHTRYWRDWSSDVCSSDLPTDPTGVKPQLVTSWPQYERVYGGFVRGAMLPHAVRGFFENGRLEERRVGEESRSWGSPYHLKKKQKDDWCWYYMDT